jgi:hypothetical protein
MGAVRFTPPGPFELRSIYLWLYHINGQGTTDTFFVSVYDTLDGNLLWQGGFVLDTAGFWIIQVDIDTVDWLSFGPGQDFYVVIGPQLGWGIYTLVFDNGTNEYRSYVNFDGTGWYQEDGGDMMVRAGGAISGDWVDLVSVCTYNDPQKFFIQDGENITLFAKITNNGTLPSTFDQYFFIRDTLGNIYYTDVVSGTVNPAETVIVQSSGTWSGPPEYYIAVDSVVATGTDPDANEANNKSVTEIRIYDPSIGNWFLYTDWSAEACYSWVPGNKWATGFLLNCYPVTLDSIAIGFGVSPDTIATDVPIELWWGMTMPETMLVTVTIDTVLHHYLHLIYFDPPLQVDSGMIFIAYPYYQDVNGNSVCLFQDQTAPRAGTNHCVHVSTFQWFTADSTWYEDNSGDWFMWAYFSDCVGFIFCGDMNGDRNVNLIDVAYLGVYFFAGGPPPVSMWAADVNGDGVVNVLDLAYLAAYFFAGGPPPDCP